MADSGARMRRMNRLDLSRRIVGLVDDDVALVAGIFAAAYLTTDIPEPDDFAQAQGTHVYFADGETEMGSFAEYNREIVDFDTLPEHVGQAVVASEDRRFYENVGVDPIAIGRALWNNLRGNPVQGGSTLTQQYVERYYIGTTTSYVGKFREAILALKIDREQSKDVILENYLNTIYFGRGAYGIQTAAQAYFGKDVSEMTKEEHAEAERRPEGESGGKAGVARLPRFEIDARQLVVRRITRNRSVLHNLCSLQRFHRCCVIL